VSESAQEHWERTGHTVAMTTEKPWWCRDCPSRADAYRLENLPKLYPLTVRHVCNLCGHTYGPNTYLNGIAQREWTEHYQTQHREGCDGTLRTLMPEG